jgi:precorrin-4/cobalt-precorrin-4 C11-methyltransferase
MGIESEICPGVSSFCAAASALGVEYTVPGVSQTLIITRAQGRTLVPESLSQLASCKASMAIFLSAGLLKETASQLMEGGFSPDAPAAIVSKASWPDEKTVRCRLGDLAEAGKDIKKTALVLAGDFLSETFQPSKLYSKDFSTGFREASP